MHFDQYLNRNVQDTIDVSADLTQEQWDEIWSKATPYEKRVARLKVDPDAAKHGRPSTYMNWGCRCASCTEAFQEMARNRRRSGPRSKADTAHLDQGHGVYRYDEGCRCSICLTAKHEWAQGMWPNQKLIAFADCECAYCITHEPQQKSPVRRGG